MAVLSPVEISTTDDASLISTTDDASFPYDLRLTVAVEDGRANVTSLTASRRKDGPPINGVGLRKIALQRLLQNAYLDSLMLVTGGDEESWTATFVDYDDELQAVAAIYRLALAVGYPPVRAVAERLGVSASTARGRVAKARSKGQLTTTVNRKAKS